VNDGQESLHVSPAAVVLNATRLGLNEDAAPMTTR
jgi:hypothetical protein